MFVAHPAFAEIPGENARQAKLLLEAGWRTRDGVGELEPPSDRYGGGYHLVAQWTWAVMRLEELLRAGRVRCA